MPAAAPAGTAPVLAPQDSRLRLAAAIAEIGRGFDGKVGISVRDVQTGWTASYGATDLYPQQSVSKLWVALTTFDRIDRGLAHLDDPVLVTRADFTVFHQPIRDMVRPAGYRTTVIDLLTRAMTQSDNTANDVLLWRAGGPAAVRATLAAKALTGIRFGPGERLLQSGTAGLTWRADYAQGDAFFRARDALPPETRRAALDRYLADPPDGAEPDRVTAALARLAHGGLLSPASTQRLLGLMAEAHTGPQRIKGGVAPGWAYAHKTGTGQELGSLATGYNDVGVLTAPSGRRFAVAVMIASTRQPIWARMQMMQSVARAVTTLES